MALVQANIIDPYIPWTGAGDYAFNDDVNAITVYIENQRPNIPKYPNIKKLIEDYESWLVHLTWLQKYYTPETSLGQAVWYRDRINQEMGQSSDPSQTPGDIMNKIVPVDPDKAPGLLGTLINSLIPAKDQKIIVGTGLALIGGYILWILGPSIKTVVTRLSQPKTPKLPTYTNSGTPISYSIRNDIIKDERP